MRQEEINTVGDEEARRGQKEQRGTTRDDKKIRDDGADNDEKTMV